jgi:hypothetical protein
MVLLRKNIDLRFYCLFMLLIFSRNI